MWRKNLFDLTAMLAGGSAGPVVLFATALVLGVLHGLEPGHSKTMMAAFIVAVSGTPVQAVLLGVSAAISHTVVVWILALLALRYGKGPIGEEMEPWFMMASGMLMIGIAIWLLSQTWRAAAPIRRNHRHADDNRRGHDHVGHNDLPRADAHARAHAAEIQKRFEADGRSTTWQTISFGLAGGLIPCPAAITVSILCLHLDRFWLGIGLVGAFSFGLAATLVAVGVAAALGVLHASSRIGWFDAPMRRAPYLSASLIVAIGLLTIHSGWARLR